LDYSEIDFEAKEDAHAYDELQTNSDTKRKYISYVNKDKIFLG